MIKGLKKLAEKKEFPHGYQSKKDVLIGNYLLAKRYNEMGEEERASFHLEESIRCFSGMYEGRWLKRDKVRDFKCYKDILFGIAEEIDYDSELLEEILKIEEDLNKYRTLLDKWEDLVEKCRYFYYIKFKGMFL